MFTLMVICCLRFAEPCGSSCRLAVGLTMLSSVDRFPFVRVLYWYVGVHTATLCVSLNLCSLLFRDSSRCIACFVRCIIFTLLLQLRARSAKQSEAVTSAMAVSVNSLCAQTFLLSACHSSSTSARRTALRDSKAAM